MFAFFHHLINEAQPFNFIYHLRKCVKKANLVFIQPINFFCQIVVVVLNSVHSYVQKKNKQLKYCINSTIVRWRSRKVGEVCDVLCKFKKFDLILVDFSQTRTLALYQPSKLISLGNIVHSLDSICNYSFRSQLIKMFSFWHLINNFYTKPVKWKQTTTTHLYYLEKWQLQSFPFFISL